MPLRLGPGPRPLELLHGWHMYHGPIQGYFMVGICIKALLGLLAHAFRDGAVSQGPGPEGFSWLGYVSWPYLGLLHGWNVHQGTI